MKITQVKLNKKQESAAGDDERILVPVFKTGNTDDHYNKFLLIESNRLIRPNKISKLKVEIERKDLTHENEIKVVLNKDGRLIIVEGQHRFVTCMEMRLPIYYRFSDMDIDDIGALNSAQDAWSLPASLHSYCSRGKHDYKILAGFKKQYSYPISTLIGVLSGRNDKSMLQEFKRGEFKVTQGLDAVHDILGKVYEYKRFNDKVYRNRTFLSVYIDLLTHPEFEHTVLIRKVEQIPTRFVNCTKVNDYLRMIEDIYNYNNRNPIKLW